MLAVIAGIMIFGVAACSKGPEKGVSEKGKEETTKAASEPAPLKEFKQDITVANPPKTMKINETKTLTVTVKNISKEAWPKKGVHLVYLWKGETGDFRPGKIVMPDGYLENDLTSGWTITTNLRLTAPDKPEKYTLRLTMVQEDVGFFDKKGAKPLDIPITVN